MKSLASYAIAAGIFLGVLLVATVIAWGLPAKPEAPLISEEPGLCPEGMLIVLRIYDTGPGSDDYDARWSIEEETFLVIVSAEGKGKTVYLKLPGRDEQTLTYEQLRARFDTPCEVAALVTGAPK